MSRGPGEVMRWVLLGVVGLYEDAGGIGGYDLLAGIAYQTPAPTGAQLSAVARACRRLEQVDLVEIYAWEDDKRKKLVGPSPWLFLALTLLAEHPEIASDSESDGFLAKLVETVRTLKEAAALGLIDVVSDGEYLDPEVRRLTLDGPLSGPAKRSDS